MRESFFNCSATGRIEDPEIACRSVRTSQNITRRITSLSIPWILFHGFSASDHGGKFRVEEEIQLKQTPFSSVSFISETLHTRWIPSSTSLSPFASRSYAAMTTAGEEAVMLASPRSATGSPRNRLKFLCSYGGRILPRPSDGNLKYVGGETRVVVVPRNTTFSGLMRKLFTLFDADVVLKYQLFSEDLDSLISVTGDEDLQNMIDEYDRQQSFVSATTPGGSAARLRAFLFPANPSLLIETTTPTADSLEQRYVDAINGIRTVTVSPSPRYNQHHLHPLYPHHHRSPSSNESSPKSGVMDQPSVAVGVAPSNDAPAVEFTPLQRVYSSPNLLGNNGSAVQQRFCGHKGGRLLGPVGRAAPGSSQVGGHQRNGGGGSGRFYSPVHKRGGGHLEESYHHRREGSGGMWEMDWRS